MDPSFPVPSGSLLAGALVVGVLAAALYVVRVHAASLNREALAMALRKLLGAKNPSRALKLTKAAPNSPLCGGMEAVLVACRDGKRPTRAQADYRQGALDDSPDAVIAWLRSEFDAAFVRVARRFTGRRVFAPIAMAVFVGVAWLAVRSETFGYAAAAAVGLLVVAHAVSVDRRIHRDGAVFFGGIQDLAYATALAPERFETEPSLVMFEGPPRLVLTIREPSGATRTVECRGDIVKIGRIATAHVVLESDRVSRLHAVVERTRDETTIIDLGSDAGTFVNGERVNKRALRAGDTVRIGDVELGIAFPEPVWRADDPATSTRANEQGS